MKTLLHALALALLVTTAARADDVYLRDGRKLLGVEARWTSKGLEVKTKYGAVVFERADVLRVVKKETPQQEYARRLKALDPADLEAALALGTFAAKHKPLRAKAPGLLLDADRRAKGTLSTIAPEAKQAVGLRKLRARIADALRGLDYHLVKEAWQAPDVYYPAHGYVKLGKRWVKKEVAERRAASRERRAAKRQAKVAARKARRGARSLEAAKKALAEALHDHAKAEARTKHYAGEAKRFTAKVKTADAERVVLEAEVTRLKSELTVVQAQYLAWHDKKCKCHGRCTCGWRKRDKALALLAAAADANYWAAYNKLKRHRKVLAKLQKSEATATALLARARKIQSKAEADLEIARLDLEDAERRAAAAKQQAEDRKDDLQDADRKLKDAGGK